MATHYNPLIATDGLVLCVDPANNRSYPASGTSAFDISGNNHVATLSSDQLYENSNGGIFSIATTGNSITVPNSPFLESIVDEVSICVWVKLNDQQTNYNNFLVKSPFSGTLGIRGSDGYIVWYSTLRNWLVGYDGPTSDRTKNNSPWRYFCFTYDGSYQRAYRNGKEFNSIATSGQFSTNSGSLNVVATSFSGEVGPATIHNKALTSNQILDNFNSMRWRFNV